MKKPWIFLYFLLGNNLIYVCNGEGAFIVKEGTLPYMVSFSSQIGICNGFMVARNVALTAAMCVTNPLNRAMEERPLNIIVGSAYRHARRGVKVQVTKILVPVFPKLGNIHEDIYMQKAPAVLLLKRKVPDILVDHPVRAIDLDYKIEEALSLQEQCFIAGWHFFARGDKKYGDKFLLQRNLRVQFVHIVKKSVWCEALMIKFQKTLDGMGFEGQFDPGATVCVADPDRQAQACHGMYGAPLVCRGKAVGMMMSSDAQWQNCSGYSNVIHLFSSPYLINFMHCVSSLFAPDPMPDWPSLQAQLYDEAPPVYYDYIADLYDKLIFVDDEEY